MMAEETRLKQLLAEKEDELREKERQREKQIQEMRQQMDDMGTQVYCYKLYYTYTLE